jgi:hypothetical protein
VRIDGEWVDVPNEAVWMDRTAPATQWFSLTTWMVIRKRAVSCLEARAEFGGRRVYKGHLPAEDVRYRKDGVIGRPSLWIAEDFRCCASG